MLKIGYHHVRPILDMDKISQQESTECGPLAAINLNRVQVKPMIKTETLYFEYPCVAYNPCRPILSWAGRDSGYIHS